MIVDADTPFGHWAARLAGKAGRVRERLPIAFNAEDPRNASKRGSVASRPTCPSTALISTKTSRSSVQTAAHTTRTDGRLPVDPRRCPPRFNLVVADRTSRGLPAGIDWAAYAGVRRIGQVIE